jgi:hypothetical protein
MICKRIVGAKCERRKAAQLRIFFDLETARRKVFVALLQFFGCRSSFWARQFSSSPTISSFSDGHAIS